MNDQIVELIDDSQKKYLINSILKLSNYHIDLLHKNSLLFPLIKSEITKLILSKEDLNEEIYNEAVSNFSKQRSLKDDKELESWLIQNNLTKESVIDAISIGVKLQTYCLNNFQAKAQSRFLERKHDLDTVTYSLVRVKDMFLAKELYLRLSSNEAKFEDIAGEYSQGPEKDTRGKVGPISLSKAHPELVSLLKAANPGEVNEPIMINQWHLIVRLDHLKSAYLNVDTELTMAKEIFDLSVTHETNALVNNLIEKKLKDNNQEEQ